MGISAGIEKFYTFAQFSSVLIFSFSLLIVLILGVFILTRPVGEGKRSFFSLLLFSFILYLISELSLSVSPTHRATIAGLYLNTAAIGLLSRVFFVFTINLSKGKFFPSTTGFALLVESLLVTAGIVTIHHRLPLFPTATLDSVQPSPVYYLFISLSICWVLAGICVLVGTSFSQSESRKKGFRLFAFSAAIMVCAFLLHHTLPGNSLFLPLPGLLLVSIFLAGRAMYSRNLMALLLHPLEPLLKEVEMTILVVNDTGSVISSNKEHIGFFSFRECSTLASFIEATLPYATLSEERMSWQNLSRNLLEYSTPRNLTLRNGKKELCLEYQATPVRYLKGRIGWLVCILDITEEMKAIRKLAEQEEKLKLSYRELSLYSKTELYLQGEKRREALIRETNSRLEGDLSALAERLYEVESDPEKDEILEAAIEGGRQSLSLVREAVESLREKKLEAG